MNKARELREMGDEQLRLVWKDAAESLFRLRLQAQKEKLAAPTDMRKHRKTIARCQTILAERATKIAERAAQVAGAQAAGERVLPASPENGASSGGTPPGKAAT
jgi:large subunit ribosomal protein L29